MTVPGKTAEEIDDQSMTVLPGRIWVISSLVRAGLAPVITPVVFGPLGVAVGAVAAAKGAGWWGTAGVSASFLSAVMGFYLVA